MSETSAAQLNFGPAWLRDTLSSEANSSGFSLPQPLGKSSYSASASSYMAFPSSSGLATAKLAEFRYGREEMLALYSSDHAPPLSCQMSAMASAGILVERPQPPLNLMGAMSEEEQKAWQRGANSDSSLKLYKKDSGGLHHAPGMGRGIGVERIGRGGGRGMAGPRGGPAGAQGFFDRHRGVDDDAEHVGVGGGRGRGAEEGGRAFGRGSSRGFDRSISERSGWFERSNSTSEEAANGGNISPRKGYTRAPFDDWRKPSSSGHQEGEEEGGPSWRGGSTASGRRWNAPHGNAPPGTVEGRGGGWRSGGSGGGDEYRAKYGDREFVNGGQKEWREDFGGRRGSHSTSSLSKYGRRPRQDSSENLPEWASEDSGPLDNRGGSFDAAGKFQASDKSTRLRPHDDVDDDQDDDWTRDDSSPNPASANAETKGVAADDEEPHFEDEEVDVDDLPSELKRDTLQQREREKAATNPQAKPDEEQLRPQQQQQQPDVSKPQQQEVVDEVSRQIVDEPVLWIYLDPQGNTQGPFNSTDMLDWFNAGYFPQDLMLRRNIDRRFIQLGEMTKRYGRIPFMSGGSVPPPLPEVEPQPPQAPADHEDKHRQQQALLFQQQLHHQLLVNQQLLQQQQLYIIQQQQQGASPAALAIAAQQLAEQQKQQQTLLAKLMQLQLTLMPQPVVPPQPAKEFTPSPSPLDFVSPLELLQHRPQQQHPPVTAPFEMPKSAADPPRQQQGGLDFGPRFERSSGGSVGSGGGTGGGYDAIKSLLSQLQETTNEYPNQTSPSIFGNASATGPASTSGFSGFGSSSQLHHQTSRPGSSHQNPDFSEPVVSHRSIWDLPVSSLRDERPPSPEPKAPTNVWMTDKRMSPVEFFRQTEQHQQQHQKNLQLQLQQQQQMLPEPEVFETQQVQHHMPQHQQQHHHHHQQQQQQQQLSYQEQLEEEESSSNGGVTEPTTFDDDDFQKPKSNEKKDKKAKRAEEKRRQKEAKRAAAAAEAAQADYIPGAPRPQQDRPQVEEAEVDAWMPEDDEASRRAAQMEALQRVQEEQQRKILLEREALAKQQQQQVKLAPWAKKNHHNSGSHDLSLAEIQKLEEEREREARIRRELEEQELRARQEAEMEQMRKQASKSLNWATAAGSNGNHRGNAATTTTTKSLAEIQAEEERQERERQERERKERKARQKEMGLAQACVWGSATANLSWATRTAAAAGPPASAQQPSQPQQQQQAGGNHKSTKQPTQGGSAWQQPQGFWDEPTPQQSQQQQQLQQQQQQQPQNRNAQKQQQQQKTGNNKGKNKLAKEETKVAAIFREKPKPQNEFEAWVGQSLEKFQTVDKLNAEFDVATFMAFLSEIESPYEVQEYVRSYIGETKAHRLFAKEYLERRSAWKNSQKAKKTFDDDLLTPAAAINPNEPDFVDIGASPGGAKSGNRSKKKGGKNKSKDVSHLLAFSVSASDRVNAGELDLPN